MKNPSSATTQHVLTVARPMLIASTLTAILIASAVMLERLEKKSHHHHRKLLTRL